MPHGMAMTHQRRRLKIGRAAFLLMQKRCSDPLCVMTQTTGWRLFLTARVAGTFVEERAYQTQRRGDDLVAGSGKRPMVFIARSNESVMDRISF